MKDVRENNKELQVQIEGLHGDIHAILTATTFDKDAFLAKRRSLQQVHDQMETNMTVAFTSAVDGLTQEELVTLTRSLHHGRSKHPHMTKDAKDTYPETP